jgi:hypothetical protein
VRLRKLTLAIALTALAAGTLAAPAVAGDPSISKLKQQLRQAKQLRERARERARLAAAGLAGARELHAATSVAGDPAMLTPATPDPATLDTATLDPATPDPATPEPLSALVVPPVSMDPTLAAALLADGVVTADEVAAQQARSVRAGRLARRWTVKVRRLQRGIRRLQQIAEWNRRGQWKPLIEIAGRKYGVGTAGLYRMMMLESGGSRTIGTTYKGLFQYYPSTWSGSWNPWRHESIYNGWAQIRATAYALSRGMGRSQWPNTYPMAF